MLRHYRHVETEEVLHLEGADHDRDPGGEPGGDRVGHELDEPPQPGHPHEDQHEAGHERGDQESAQPVQRSDGRQDDDEGGRRTRHLDSRSAEKRRHRAADDGRVEAGLRRHSGGDGKRQRQRQRDDPDDGARHEIGAQIAARVSAAQRVAQNATGPQGRDLDGARQTSVHGARIIS